MHARERNDVDPDRHERCESASAARRCVHFDDGRIEAFDGETVERAVGARHRGWDGGRAYFCAMGVCQQCAVWIDAQRVEAAAPPARNGHARARRGP
jgi:hypothetical protein